ncbi:solute carrier family 17 member 9 isoform X5 [Mustela putorius furo]|uniref:Solute carrier family 17 member 9 isoform X5 n=1 Tax=Mustela putorius furo TaxID=9669 RepID=A0A8U0UT50_MUSPF|nr:solute carrier family 17 member 9 isoform X5 [Mustela putorius furo]
MQPQPLPLEEARGDGAENTQWSRPECQTWTATLLLGTCLLYCARVSVPVCTVSMSQDFGWNKKEAGLVLSSFFWGYCLTQVVGGHLGDRIGGEKVILLSACAWGFLTAATPLLAHLSGAHLVFMTFSRILTGLLQGVYFPALTSLLSQKVRESERAFTYSTVGAGSQFGMLVTGAVGSLLLDRYGWPSVFYFSGGLTLLWVCYVYRCLLNGKDLILALGILAQGLPMSRHTKVPWRQLFRKPSVWAAISSQLSSAGSFFILLSWLPSFFQETFPSSKGWVFNVVPWLVAIPASLFSGFLSDHLINQAAPAGTQQGPSGPQHKWADGTVSPSPPLRLQDHHRAEVHAGREGRDEPLWTPVCSWDPRGLTSSGPTQKAFGGCPRSVLGAGLAALSASPSCVGGFSVPPSLARGPGCFPLSLTSGTGLSRSLASHIPRSGGLSSVRHGLCPATPLLPQVMGLGLSSVFALCLGHTSSFCTSVVFASASIGLQTFNHSGISVNIQDLAPSCAGFLFGVANTAGALAGVVGVCLGGYLLETTGSWASMFNLVAAVGSLGLCTFLLFGEAQRVDLSPAHEDL